MVEFHILDAGNAARLMDAGVFDNPVDPAQLQSFVDDAGHLLVFATDGPGVVGFASGTILRHPDKDPVLFLNEVDVTPERQREGIGRELCVRLMALAKDAGCQGTWLATEVDNAPARALYRSLRATESTGVVIYDWDAA